MSAGTRQRRQRGGGEEDPTYERRWAAQGQGGGGGGLPPRLCRCQTWRRWGDAADRRGDGSEAAASVPVKAAPQSGGWGQGPPPGEDRGRHPCRREAHPPGRVGTRPHVEEGGASGGNPRREGMAPSGGRLASRARAGSRPFFRPPLVGHSWAGWHPVSIRHKRPDAQRFRRFGRPPAHGPSWGPPATAVLHLCFFLFLGPLSAPPIPDHWTPRLSTLHAVYPSPLVCGPPPPARCAVGPSCKGDPHGGAATRPRGHTDAKRVYRLGLPSPQSQLVEVGAGVGRAAHASPLAVHVHSRSRPLGRQHLGHRHPLT